MLFDLIMKSSIHVQSPNARIMAIQSAHFGRVKIKMPRNKDTALTLQTRTICFE